MKPALLDVNVLVALAWPSHVHHEVAHRWLASRGKVPWVTCPTTQAGFVRVSSNRTALPEAKTPREALALLRRIVAVPGHQFWPDDIAFADSPFVADHRLHGYRQVPDAHLLAVALRHGGCLATFDRAVRGLVPEGLVATEAVNVVLDR